MLILPDASEKSVRLLQQAIADKFRITMLIIGDGPGVDVVASKCDVRAQALASTRRVVWVRDPEVLPKDLWNQWTKGGSALVCVLNLDDVPVAWLTQASAQSFTNVELAFAKAQQG
jgi:hypothetical protein